MLGMRRVLSGAAHRHGAVRTGVCALESVASRSAVGCGGPSAVHPSYRAASTAGSGHDEGGFMARLKSLYHEFQVSQDRRLDAMAAEEAQESHADSPRSASAHRKGKTAQGTQSPLISRNAHLCPRSVLFVPGSKPRAMAKIPSLPADCFILDLEDSVGVGSKRQARENIREFVEGLQSGRQLGREARAAEAGAPETDTGVAGGAEGRGGASTCSDGGYPRLVVRINSPDFDPATAMLDMELVGLLGPAIEGIAIPKVTPRTYALIKDYVHPDHQLWAFFESPQSILQADLICQQRVYQYAVMGYNDLSMELQLPSTASLSSSSSSTSSLRLPVEGEGPEGEGEAGGAVSEAVRESLYLAAHLPLWQCTTQVLLAARAHNMFVLDAVFNDTTDRAGFRRSLRECRALGLNGKTLIHPSQIEPTNAAYTPTEADVTLALRTVEAVRMAQGGVATVDGKMVEELHRRQADRVLALHRSAEAERLLHAVRAAEATEATEAGAGGTAESAREPRRTPPSRHRSLS